MLRTYLKPLVASLLNALPLGMLYPRAFKFGSLSYMSMETLKSYYYMPWLHFAWMAKFELLYAIYDNLGHPIFHVQSWGLKNMG